MNKSRLLKERNEDSGELSNDDCDEGNCARTRPVSLDEIMLRRKNKHVSVGAAIESEAIQRDDIVETVPDHYKSEGQRDRKGRPSTVEKKESDQNVKSQSRKKEKKADVKKHSSSKEIRVYDQESGMKSKEKLSKDIVSKLSIDKTDKDGRGRRNGIGSKPAKGHQSEFSSMDKHRDRSKEKFAQDVHEERNIEKSFMDRYRGVSKEKTGNDRYEERGRDKCDNDRHGERSIEKSGIDRHGERNIEKSGIDRHGERSIEKSGIDRHGDRNLKRSGNNRHGETKIEKSGNDRHEERSKQKSGSERYGERNIEKSGDDRHRERKVEKSGTDKYEERSKQKSSNDKYEGKRSEKSSEDKLEERRKEKLEITGEHMRGKPGIDKNDKRGREKTEDDKLEEGRKERMGNDRYRERTREISERESKRKHRLGEDEKFEDRISKKKHDAGRMSETKEKRESDKHYNEDSKLKRRRSRSREHGMEKSRGSLSPKERKRTSFPDREQEESLKSLNDKPGRQHSETDRNKTSSNGLKGHYHRHSVSSSGLGGYSPRKRKTDAAAKTPSPANQSPDSKRDWRGLPSGGTSNKNFASATSNFQSSNQTALSSIPVPANVAPIALNTRSLFGAPYDGFSAKITASVDSVQLTEATRPQRRLYVENIPESVTEKALMEFINNSMCSSCIYHIQGSQPCISCIINKQKGQALVEFLTPEDASAALSFDGSSIAGSILKVRRPKDFVEVATGELRKSTAIVNQQNLLDPIDAHKSVDTNDLRKTVATVDTISDSVKESPHKVVICGIAEAISSEMVIEIASAFGLVRSCYCELSGGQTYATLEYVNQSITPKACAGLNGMKMGGKVITVIETVPGMSSLGTTGNSLLFEIPEHARPLLEKPTPVIKLKNVITRESLRSLPESELEEVLEDVRIECARFGSVKSVNIVKYNSNIAADSSGTNGSNGFLVSGLKSGCDKNNPLYILEEATGQETREISRKDSENHPYDLSKDRSCQSNVVAEDNDVPTQQHRCSRISSEDSADVTNQISPSNEPSHCHDDEKAPENPLHGEKTCRDYGGECQDEIIAHTQTAHIVMEASENLLKCHKSTSKDHSDIHDEKIADAVHTGDSVMDITAEDISTSKENDNDGLPGSLARDEKEEKELNLTGAQGPHSALASDNSEGKSDVKCENKELDTDLNYIFEPGSVFVEYKRTEASCMAAHSLHGRSYDGQTVMVEYFPLGLYRARFSK